MSLKTKQRKVSIPVCELELAKDQAKKDGFGTNLTGWVRWLIRTRCGMTVPNQNLGA
jgi:hypothetical protein